MGSEIEKITKLRGKISRIASPIRKKINEISSKSRDICDEAERVQKIVYNRFNYLLGKSLDVGPKVINKSIPLSLTSKGIHETGYTGSRVCPFESKMRISKDKKDIVFQEAYKTIKVPLSYFQSDMRGKIKDLVLLMKKSRITASTSFRLSPDISFKVRNTSFDVKHAGNSYYVSLDSIENKLSHSNYWVVDEKINQKALDQIDNIEAKVFKVLRKRIKEQGNIAKLISEYSIPFRMMEKLKRNSS